MSKIRTITVTTALVLCSATAAVADILDDIGHTDLVERLGATAPTGAGVVVVDMGWKGSCTLPR